MKTDFYTKVGNYYDQEALEFDGRYWRNPVLQKIRQAFRDEVKRQDYNSMLEIGCGTGLDLVHFANIHPEVFVHGIDISNEMVGVTRRKIEKLNLTNVEVHQAAVEDLPTLYSGKKFDLIYVFFGALNTVDSLQENAEILTQMLSPKGTMVLSFVNKWYLGGIVLETVRFRFRRAFARIKPIWGGYSPIKYLPSKCYTPKQVNRAFHSVHLKNKFGFSILHPAWYFTRINQKISRFSRVLWKIDERLSRWHLWRFGEYTLFTFEHSKSAP